MKVILEEARLTLRELLSDDLELMAEMLADAEVMQYYLKRLTRELSTDWADRQIARYKADGYCLSRRGERNWHRGTGGARPTAGQRHR